MRKHNHYYRPFPWASIDVYRLLAVYEVTCPIRQHVIKKLLVAGNRGAKDLDRDIQDAIDSLVRLQEMRAEDAAIAATPEALAEHFGLSPAGAPILVAHDPDQAAGSMRALVDSMDADDARDAADTLRGHEAIAAFLDERAAAMPPGDGLDGDPRFLTGTGADPVQTGTIVLHRVGVAANGEVDPAIVSITLTEGSREVSFPDVAPEVVEPAPAPTEEMIVVVDPWHGETRQEPASLYLPFERLPATPGVYVRLVPLDEARFREYFAHWDGVAWGVGRCEKFQAKPRTPGAGSPIVCRWRFLKDGE